jgi:hypothetical protein
MPGKRWSEEDIEFLHSNCKTHTVADFMEALGRSKAAIHGKMCRIGISPKFPTSPRLLNTEQYIESIKDKPLICVDEYIGVHIPIMHRCNVCGNEWKTQPGHIKSGTGCPVCASVTGFFKPECPAYLYLLLVENSGETFLKVGITGNSPEHRAHQIRRTCVENTKVSHDH